MFNDDSDEDNPCDVIPFVGRGKERETVKELLGHSVRTVQLTGPPMVGKARLAEEISKELQQEMDSKDRKLLCYHMSCRDVSTMSDLLALLSACLSMEETAESEKALVQHFQAIVKNEKKCAHLFVFLKCENLHKNSFYVQFVDIVRKFLQVSKKVFVLITTQKSFNISNSKEVKVAPLSNSDTVTLVRRYSPNVDIDPYVSAIEKHCYGLPPLAMDAAQELAKASVPYTPEEFTELLSTENRSKRVHRDNDVLNAVAMAQFSGLNDYLRQRIIDVSIFRGSFRVDDVLNMIGDTRLEAVRNLNEMISSGLVEYVDDGRRMHLQTVIGHYVRNLMGSHIAYDDTVRLRFVTLFVDVLKKADSELFIKPQQTVFGYLHDDWPNLKQVLEEAIHCTEHTYTTFLKVSVSAENLLVKCFPGEAVKFYEAMMMASTKFGTREECAIQKWLLGMAKTIGKGQDLVEAMGLFNDALPILKQAENPETLVSLLADMGLNYNRQGKNAKSRKFYLEALEESGRCTDGRKLTNRVINIRCYLAIPMIFLEYFDQAEDLLKETLEETKKVAPYHPAIPIMINSLGLIYERAGKSDDEALRYYTNSLTERRKYADVAPGDLVVVLNNVAMQHSKRGNHDYALQLLSEARQIRMKIERINYHTALTCWDMGQVYGRKREYKSALSEITDALDIFKRCTSSHFVIVEVLIQAAHFASCLMQYEEAEGYFLEALKLDEKYQELCPTGNHILLILQHLLMTYLSWKKMCSPYLDRAVAEVSRLLENHRPSSSLEKNACYWQQKQALYRVRSELDQAVVSGELLKDFLDELLGFCYICNDLKSRGEDMVDVFHSMTTSVCSDLASAETLLRSKALSTAAQILREASGSSNSPPLSPTQETSDPPSCHVDNPQVAASQYEIPGVQEFSRDFQQIPQNAAYQVITQNCTIQGNRVENFFQGIPSNCHIQVVPQNDIFKGVPREKDIYGERNVHPDFQTHLKTGIGIPSAANQYDSPNVTAFQPIQGARNNLPFQNDRFNTPTGQAYELYNQGGLVLQQNQTNPRISNGHCQRHLETFYHRDGNTITQTNYQRGLPGEIPQKLNPNIQIPDIPNGQMPSNMNTPINVQITGNIEGDQHTRVNYRKDVPVQVTRMVNSNIQAGPFPFGQMSQNTNSPRNGHLTTEDISRLQFSQVNTRDSLNINVDLLNRPPNLHTENQTNIYKQKTVEDSWTVDSQPVQQEQCPFDPTLKFPPNHRFQTYKEEAQEDPVLAENPQRPEHDLERLVKSNLNLTLNTSKSLATENNFRAKLASYQSTLQESKNRLAGVHNHVTDQRSSSGYDSSANGVRHRQNRLSESSQRFSSPPNSGGTTEPAENDDRLLGTNVCCRQPNCTCSLSKTEKF